MCSAEHARRTSCHPKLVPLRCFDVVSGYVKQLPCPCHKCFLCLRNPLRESSVIIRKERGLLQSFLALLSSDLELPVFIIPPVTLANASACVASTSAKKADGVCVRCHKKRAQSTNVRCVECQAYHSAHKKRKRADLKRGINLASVDWRYGEISPTIRVRSARLTIFILRIAVSSSTMKAKNTAGSRHLHPTENFVGNGDR
jgi:cytochrome c553